MSLILIYGRPGSGKTTLACTMTKLGYRVNIIEPDQKANNMMNIKEYIDQGKVIVMPIREKLSEISMKSKILTPKLALTKQPKGYLAICDLIGQYEKEVEEGKTRMNEVLVVDSLTSTVEHLKRLISKLTGKDKFGFDEWNMLLVNLEDFFYTMLSLQKVFKHVIVIAHEMVEKDEDSGRILNVLPAVEGSMRNKLTKYFDEAYHTRVDVKNGKAKFLVATIPYEKAEARTTRNLDTLVDSDFSTLFKEELAEAPSRWKSLEME